SRSGMVAGTSGPRLPPGGDRWAICWLARDPGLAGLVAGVLPQPGVGVADRFRDRLILGRAAPGDGVYRDLAPVIREGQPNGLVATARLLPVGKPPIGEERLKIPNRRGHSTCPHMFQHRSL